MAVEYIESTDKLQSGFRAKYNLSVAQIIVSFTDNGDGTVTATLFGGDTLSMDLTDSFFTKQEVIDLLASYVPGRQPVEYEYDQTFLVEDGIGSGNWYLPYKKPDDSPIADGVMPYFITSVTENDSDPLEFDTQSIPISGWQDRTTWIEPRIYGFSDSSINQTITIFAL